uniref:Uncharacterized protein n=1 Tax=Cucumis melo TaxID=3656 RepID=A0A9I9CUQ9_CUCME
MAGRKLMESKENKEKLATYLQVTTNEQWPIKRRRADDTNMIFVRENLNDTKPRVRARTTYQNPRRLPDL